ncbi:MAG: 50S ribosomal protein L35 [Candidatus Magnetoovum sp. WYHC-5]|nr:50S ribosomal protein L35 [Candidatus Magnetoovum sp. WYHC-5]
MPKLKTHRGAEKRFRKTSSGKIKRNKAYRRHILSHKSAKRKRGLRSAAFVSDSEQKNISALIPYL